jgi:hypothetical protein
MNARYVGYSFCALAMIGVGSTVVVSKAIAGGLPPFAATALRFAIAFPVFVAMMRVRKVRWPKLDAHDALLVIAQAGAGSVGYTVCLIGGMRLASAADAGVIAGTLPAVSVGFLARLRSRRWACSPARCASTTWRPRAARIPSQVMRWYSPQLCAKRSSSCSTASCARLCRLCRCRR